MKIDDQPKSHLVVLHDSTGCSSLEIACARTAREAGAYLSQFDEDGEERACDDWEVIAVLSQGHVEDFLKRMKALKGYGVGPVNTEKMLIEECAWIGEDYVENKLGTGTGEFDRCHEEEFPSGFSKRS